MMLEMIVYHIEWFMQKLKVTSFAAAANIRVECLD